MNSPPPLLKRLAALMFAFGVLGGIGCAGLRVPRIDPTGERLFTRPAPQSQRAAPVVGNSGSSNPVAAPVLTDPFFPTQPVAAAPPVEAPTEVLKVSPERILAAIGSEVVLKAGICDPDGYLLSDQKLEWQLARNGVGQFVQVGGKGLMEPALLPWNQASKIDNYFAKGYTAASPLCINRGTADPTDDVNIRRGDGWVSVSSPSEGTSYVTAYAPGIKNWRARQSTAQIHWVDVQWSFPPANVNSNGQPQTLTTTVTRQSDSTPLEGYLVRYEVADGGALRSQETGQVVEVRTDSRGQATVEVAPTDSGANSSRIEAQVIRPANYGNLNSPRLVISSGSTLVNWNGNEPYITPGDDFGSPATPLPPRDSRPWEPTPAEPNTPTPAPQLDVQISRISAGPVEVGGLVRFEVVVRNLSNAPATGLKINDVFQEGLRHVADPNGYQEITAPIEGTLMPGQTVTDEISFDVTRAGELCHDVTITTAEGASESKRACVTAVQPAPQLQPAMNVKKVGPELGVVGENALHSVSIRNTGEVPLLNVEIVDEYPMNFFDPQPRDPRSQKASDPSRNVWRIIHRIPRLEVGATDGFDVDARCLRPTARATSLVDVTAQVEGSTEGLRRGNEHSMEINPPLGGGTPGVAQPANPNLGVAPQPAPNNGLLTIDLLSNRNTLRANERAHYRVTVKNISQQPDENIQMRVILPPEMSPDPNTAQGPPDIRTEVVGNELRFTAVLGLRPGAELAYEFDVNVLQPGNGTIRVEAASLHVPTETPAYDSENVSIIR